MVQVKQGDNLVVFTQPNGAIDKVKVTDANNVMTTLTQVGNTEYSLVGFLTGAYVLDVIVNLGDDERGAYETILVILAQGQQPVPPAQVINQVKQKTDVKVVFEDDDDDKCSNKPGSAGLPFPQDKRTECEKRDYDRCEKKGFKTSGGFCDNIYELFNDDDCFGFANGKECDDYFNDQYKFCQENPNHKKCASPPPPCDENTPTGQLCRDEGDRDTCDPGYVDRGNGCEPEDVYCLEGSECPELPIPCQEAGDCPELPIELPKVPDEGEDNDSGSEDNGNEDNGNDDNDNGGSEQPEDPPEDNQGSDTDTDTG